MKVQRYTFTVITFVFFVIALHNEGLFFGVSGETELKQHTQITVKQGVTQDSSLALYQVNNAPHLPPSKKSLNRERTLRAFIAPSQGGLETLFIESVQPHGYYAITGRFSVSREYPSLLWADSGVLVFYAKSEDGLVHELALDVATLVLEVRLADESEALEAELRTYDIPVM